VLSDVVVEDEVMTKQKEDEQFRYFLEHKLQEALNKNTDDLISQNLSHTLRSNF